MEFIFLFCVGAFMGYILSITVLRSRSIGTLRIDRSDPTDGPYLFLELERDVGYVSRERYVTFKVSNESYISHE